MLDFVKIPLAALALLAVGLMSPVAAQSASEIAVRMQQLEDQVRRLTGQVEELTFEVKQLRAQAGAGAAAAGQSGAVQPMTPPAAQVAEQPGPSQQKRLAAASAGTPIPDSNDIEVIQQQPIGAPPQTGEADLAAPGVQVLGAMDNAAAQPNDGGFQGKVLVPPSQQEPGDDAFVQQQQTEGNAIETVSLDPAATGESPEALYERSNESLLRRQFAEAEAGFSNFLQKYPDHGLAGAAQYWLGETFYAQGDFKRAAASFLQGYKKYPKSRRAPDSLLKLGISLNRLGQGEQACAAYAAVSAEYPKAVDARKRAQAEAKRAGCAS